MTVIISIIINLIKNKLFEFFKSKYFLLSLICIIAALYIIFLNIKLNSKDKKIDILNEQIISLETENILINKNLMFKSNQMYIKDTFSNSDQIIEKQQNNQLSSNTIEAFNSIIYDYKKAMQYI